MPGSAGDLYAAAVELLDATVTALADAPDGPPDSRAVWPGLPAYDCAPALYVHCGGSQIANTYPLQPPLQPMQRIVTTGMVELVSFTITILRCVPGLLQQGQTIRLPPSDQIEAAASSVYGDLWAIWNGLKNQHRAGTLYQVPSGRREFEFQPAIPIRSSGGVGGWEIPIGVQLGGYNA